MAFSTDQCLCAFVENHSCSPSPGVPTRVVGPTGSLTDGEQWQGTFGVEQNLASESSSSFLRMSTPEPATLLPLAIGMFGLAFRRRRFVQD